MVFIVICLIVCRNTKSQVDECQEGGRKNENRSGSVLDFLEDFTIIVFQPTMPNITRC